MAKIMVCDKCKTDKEKLTETSRYFIMKGRPDLRIDLCKDCTEEFHAKTGRSLSPDYVLEVYRLHGIKLTPQQAQDFAKRGW